METPCKFENNVFIPSHAATLRTVWSYLSVILLVYKTLHGPASARLSDMFALHDP